MKNEKYTLEEMIDFLYSMLDETDIENEPIINAVIEKLECLE